MPLKSEAAVIDERFGEIFPVWRKRKARFPESFLGKIYLAIQTSRIKCIWLAQKIQISETCPGFWESGAKSFGSWGFLTRFAKGKDLPN